MERSSKRWLEDPLKFGPITIHGALLEGSGVAGTALHLYPAADGLQHAKSPVCDPLDQRVEKLPSFLRRLVAGFDDQRTVRKDARLHPKVLARFELGSVPKSADGVAPYRPAALEQHELRARFYPDKVLSARFPFPPSGRPRTSFAPGITLTSRNKRMRSASKAQRNQ